MADHLLKLGQKRAFIQRSHHPYGPEACQSIGLVPSSVDVNAAEMRETQVNLWAGFESMGDFVSERADWYVDAVDGLEASGALPPEVERTLLDHIIAFGIALLIEERVAAP